MRHPSIDPHAIQESFRNVVANTPTNVHRFLSIWGVFGGSRDGPTNQHFHQNMQFCLDRTAIQQKHKNTRISKSNVLSRQNASWGVPGRTPKPQILSLFPPCLSWGFLGSSGSPKGPPKDSKIIPDCIKMTSKGAKTVAGRPAKRTMNQSIYQ